MTQSIETLPYVVHDNIEISEYLNKSSLSEKEIENLFFTCLKYRSNKILKLLLERYDIKFYSESYEMDLYKLCYIRNSLECLHILIENGYVIPLHYLNIIDSVSSEKIEEVRKGWSIIKKYSIPHRRKNKISSMNK